MLRATALTVFAIAVGAAAALVLSPGQVHQPQRPTRGTAARRGPSPAKLGAPRNSAEVEYRADAEPVAATAPEALHDADPDPVTYDVKVIDGESGALLDVPVRIERAGDGVELSIDPPAGMLPAVTSTANLHASLRPDTHTLRATFVLVPAVRVVLAPDVRFRGRVRCADVFLGKHRMQPVGKRPLVYRVPRHAGARLIASIETAEKEGKARVEIAPDDRHVVVPIPYDEPQHASVGVTCRGAPGMRSIARSGTASLAVRVFAGDGRPARRAEVRLDAITPDDRQVSSKGVTDDAGCVVFTELAESQGTLTVVPRRGLPSVVDVTVEEGENGEIRVDAPTPATATVTVVDRTGRPVCGARVVVRFDGEPCAPFEPGVQQLTHVTDATGRCVLRGVPPRGLVVEVRWGDTRATAEALGPARFAVVLPHARGK